MPHVPHKLSKYFYTWKNFSRFELLVDGPVFYTHMLAAIEQAQHSILIIQYIFISGNVASRFIHALIEASQRGVSVQIILDDFGSQKLVSSDRSRLQAAGIKLVFYNPLRLKNLHHYLYRDHRKLLVIDNQTAFIGGAGISDDYSFTKLTPRHWHDVMVKLEGDVVLDCVHLFNKIWTKYFAALPDIKTRPNTAYTQSGQLLISKPLFRHEIHRAFIHYTKLSRQRVWIATPYFLPSRKIRRQLKRAAYRGCDVRLLLPGPNMDHPSIWQIARHLYTGLLRKNIRIYEYMPNFIHAKVMLCDEWSSIGSSNLDRWNQRFNRDLNIAVQDTVFNQHVVGFFESGFKHAHEIKLDDWLHRSRIQRLREWFWNYVARWIERKTRKIR